MMDDDIEPVSLILRARPAWHRDAACKTSDLDFTSPNKTTIAAALQVCGRTCKVMAECRAWSLTIDDNVSVLGGLDASARRQARKRLDATP